MYQTQMWRLARIHSPFLVFSTCYTPPPPKVFQRQTQQSVLSPTARTQLVARRAYPSSASWWLSLVRHRFFSRHNMLTTSPSQCPHPSPRRCPRSQLWCSRLDRRRCHCRCYHRQHSVCPSLSPSSRLTLSTVSDSFKSTRLRRRWILFVNCLRLPLSSPVMDSPSSYPPSTSYPAMSFRLRLETLSLLM